MNGRHGGDIRRYAAGFFSVLVVVAVLLSVSYLAAEEKHDCTGEHCPVCACLQQCEALVQRLRAGTGVFCLAAFALLFLCGSSRQAVCFLTPHTPITRKVRLND